MKIRLNVERLVLEGLPISRSQGPLVQAAIEAELARLLADGGLEAGRGGAMPDLPAGSIQLSSGDGPEAIGRKIAGSVYRSLGR